jgi:uncharacterized protein (TIRG00374 family)
MNKILGKVLLAIFLAAFGLYFYTHSEDFTLLLDANPALIVLLVITHISTIFVAGINTKIVLKPFGYDVGYRDSYIAALLSTIGNFILPVGSGTSLRAVYLKRKYKFNYSHFLSTVYGAYILAFMIASLAGIVGLAGLSAYKDLPAYTVALVVLLAIFLGSFLIALPTTAKYVRKLVGKFQLPGKAGDISLKIIDGWLKIRRDKFIYRRFIVITAINVLLIAATAYLAAKSLGLDFGIYTLLLYSAIGSLSIVTNITPGSIGIRESIYLLLSAVLGFSTAQILSIAVVDRLSRFSAMFVSWLYFREELHKWSTKD